PSDLKTDIDNGCQVWVVDPGISTVFTIVDQAGRVRSLDQKEYYHLCGFNDAAHIRKIHQAKHTNTHRMITELDSLKTGEVSKFLIACIKRIESYDTMYEFYNRGLWSSKLKFRCYRKKQKAFSEIVKMFTHDSIKCRTGVSTNVKTTTRNNNSYSRPPPLDGSVKANKTIIAYRD
ncbi:hypothetical protein BD408DRAFT_322111, partial [Parasitella parasitica]